MLVCDICKKPATDTIILYRRKIDYCDNCKSKAAKIRRAIRNSIKYYNDVANKNIIEAEQRILKENKIR